MASIRQATVADAQALQALAEAFATSFKVQPDSVDKTLPALLERDDACVLVAEDDGAVGYLLGFVHSTFHANGPIGWVEEVMVAPSHRRQGLGGDLMTGFERWVVSKGGKVVALATRRAAEFYQAIGYEASAVYYRKAL